MTDITNLTANRLMNHKPVNFGGRNRPAVSKERRNEVLGQVGRGIVDLSPVGDVIAMGEGIRDRDPLQFGLGIASLALPGTIKPEAAGRFGKLVVDKIRALNVEQEVKVIEDLIRNPESADKFIKSAGLKTDNPGGKWLIHEKERAAKLDTPEGLRHGSVTATIETELPVNEVLFLRGMEGEQRRIFSGDKRVADLAKKIKKEGFDPKSPIFINVGHDGTALINEGNHRIRAAKEAGLKTVPVDISYFAGGEDVVGEFSKKNLSIKIFDEIIGR